ncbi:MAG: S8 family serine peptidase [Lentisphaeria bacterium]
MLYKIMTMMFGFCVLLQAKPSDLPATQFEKSMLSDEVNSFVEKEKLKEDSVRQVRKTTVDVLGRYRSKADTTSYYINAVSKDKMKVSVSYLDYGPAEDTTTTGRFEIDSKTGAEKYWLNEKEMAKATYKNEIEKLQKRPFWNPGYSANLSADDIENLLKANRKVLISKFKEPKGQMNYSSILSMSQITTHAFSNSFKGDSIGVYFNDTGCPNLTNVNTNYYVQANTCARGVRMHPTGVTRVLQVTAPKATIYGFDQGEYPDPDAYNPKIEIGSHSWNLMLGEEHADDYYSTDEEFDNYIYNNRVIIFAAAGNKNDDISQYWVMTPGKALNAITVGAIDPTNNQYKDYSMWKNSEVGNQKPEMANYTDFYFPGDYSFTDVGGSVYSGFFNGTSAATPYSAAMAADLLQQYPFFKRHPELFKAFVLSGEKIAIGNASSHDQDNNSVAAEAVPRYSSLGWNHRFRFWSGNNSCCFNASNKITFTESTITANVHYRIAIAWLTSGTYVLQNKRIAQDIDLRVYQNGSLIASSVSASNPFEVVDFTAPASGDLTIEIRRYANSGTDNVVLGYSLWNDL